ASAEAHWRILAQHCSRMPEFENEKPVRTQSPMHARQHLVDSFVRLQIADGVEQTNDGVVSRGRHLKLSHIAGNESYVRTGFSGPPAGDSKHLRGVISGRHAIAKLFELKSMPAGPACQFQNISYWKQGELVQTSMYKSRFFRIRLARVE